MKQHVKIARTAASVLWASILGKL